MKKGKFFVMFLVMVLMFSAGVYMCNRYYSGKGTGDILRLHILANSNSAEDQALKIKVRDYVSGKILSLSEDATSVQENEKIIIENKEEIINEVKTCIENEGYDYEVKIEVGSFSFPTKYHNGKVLPAGEYDAVRIIIGEGKGDNWWCVLFPPLGFSRGVEQECKQDECCEMTEEKINIRFKIVDIFEDVKSKLWSIFDF